MTSTFLSSLSDFMFSARNAMVGRLKTVAARQHASLNTGTRLGCDGSVVNIGKVEGRIEVGRNGTIRGELLTFAHGGRISVGDWFYLGPTSTIWSSDTSGISIGNRVLISFGAHIHDTDSHPLSPVARFEQTRQLLTSGHPRDIETIRSAPVRIGDDVWIGMGALVMKGVTIGDRAIIGARSIVRGDVPDDGFVAPGTIHAPSKT